MILNKGILSIWIQNVLIVNPKQSGEGGLVPPWSFFPSTLMFDTITVKFLFKKNIFLNLYGRVQGEKKSGLWKRNLK